MSRIVAAHFETFPEAEKAVRELSNRGIAGKDDLEAAEGTWRDGHRADFHPAAPQRLIEGDESGAL
jgi:hypothetical protein